MIAKREIAKFASGAACWEAIGHLMLATSDLLPLTVWGVTVTATMNVFWIVLMFVLSALLAHFGWGTVGAKDHTRPTSRVEPRSPSARI